jgi:hypothetical protein
MQRLIFIILCLTIVVMADCTKKPQAHVLAGSDRYQVAEIALSHIMEEYSDSGKNPEGYYAYVVDGGEFTSQLVKAFSGYQPKVIGNIQVKFDTNGVPYDKTIDKPVELWKVEDIVVQGDSATASVSAYQSSQGAEWYTVHLRYRDGKWIFESKTLDLVS